MTLGHALVILGIIFGTMAVVVALVLVLNVRLARMQPRDPEYWTKQPP